jgi:hypothetical protein
MYMAKHLIARCAARKTIPFFKSGGSQRLTGYLP